MATCPHCGHHFTHSDEWLIFAIFKRLDHIDRNINTIAQNEGIIMATVADIVTDLESETDVVNGIVTLLDQVKADLDAALASGDPAAVQSALDLIDSHKQSLADAIVRDTPAAP